MPEPESAENSRSRRDGRRRVRWLGIGALVATICVVLAVHWFTKPLPPPVVSLSLVGFKVYPTNAYAVMVLSNLGPTRIYFDPRDWSAEFQTARGVITNYGRGFSFASFGTKQNSNEVFLVEVPASVREWRLEANFGYYKRRHLRFELAERLVDSGMTDSWIWRPFESFDLEWLWKLDPQGRYDSVATAWLTNLPPSAASP